MRIPGAHRPFSRRARRRLLVLGGVALLAATLPLWAPRLLSEIPAFRVERIEVLGTVHVAPNEILELAGIGREASVWDDAGEWERRVETHALVVEATVGRVGLRTLEIRVVEETAVALVAVPELVAINSEGRLLALDPATAALNLPILAGVAEVDEDRVRGDDQRELAALLGKLERYDPAFVERISQIAARGDAVEIWMLPDAGAERILLPRVGAIEGLRRVELALGDAEPRRVRTADARYEGQVVISFTGGS